MNNNTDQLFSQITATQADITRSISLLAAMVSDLTQQPEGLDRGKESEDHYAKETETEANSQAITPTRPTLIVQGVGVSLILAQRGGRSPGWKLTIWKPIMHLEIFLWTHSRAAAGLRVGSELQSISIGAFGPRKLTTTASGCRSFAFRETHPLYSRPWSMNG